MSTNSHVSTRCGAQGTLPGPFTSLPLQKRQCTEWARDSAATRIFCMRTRNSHPNVFRRMIMCQGMVQDFGLSDSKDAGRWINAKGTCGRSPGILYTTLASTTVCRRSWRQRDGAYPVAKKERSDETHFGISSGLKSESDG
jgi:hypothetical protein